MVTAREGLLGSLVALAACAAPVQQVAPPSSQTPKTPTMPSACDLEQVPIGAWAEYEEKLPNPMGGTTTERRAAVARGPEGLTIEHTYSPPSGTVAMVLAPRGRPEDRLKRVTFQDGDYDPMDNPIDHIREAPYPDLDRRTFIGEEEVSVRAGTFRSKRYRYKTSFDETVDVWINDTLWPTCVIKLDAELKQPWLSGRFTNELIATGTGATRKITRPAIPWNVEVLKKRGEAQRARPPAAPPPGESSGERR